MSVVLFKSCLNGGIGSCPSHSPCFHLLEGALDASLGDLEERGRWVKREAWRGRRVGESPCLPIPLTTTWPCVPSTPRLTPCANPCSITHAFALLASAHPCQPKDQLDALMAINKPKPSHFTTSTTPPHSLTPPSLTCSFALCEQQGGKVRRSRRQIHSREGRRRRPRRLGSLPRRSRAWLLPLLLLAPGHGLNLQLRLQPRAAASRRR